MSSKTKNKKGLSWPPTPEDLEKAGAPKAAPAAKVSKKKQKAAAPVCAPPVVEKKRGRKKKVVEAPQPVDPGSKSQKKQKKQKVSRKTTKKRNSRKYVSQSQLFSPAARGKKEIVLTPGELAMWKAKGGWIAAVFSWAFFVTFWLLGVI